MMMNGNIWKNSHMCLLCYFTLVQHKKIDWEISLSHSWMRWWCESMRRGVWRMINDWWLFEPVKMSTVINRARVNGWEKANVFFKANDDVTFKNSRLRNFHPYFSCHITCQFIIIPIIANCSIKMTFKLKRTINELTYSH